tara:strand:+ start:73 stop:273 length:201 start_codon:yes stop_codon:yes gene_type:complete
MKYPRWEYKLNEITIYWSEHNYVTYYDEDASDLFFDLEYGTKYERKYILNELYDDYKHSDQYSRGD